MVSNYMLYLCLVDFIMLGLDGWTLVMREGGA